LRQWPRDGVPENPSSWLIGAAHHKALDWVRREARRGAKEEAAMRAVLDRGSTHEHDRGSTHEHDRIGDDQLAVIFTCCHPALDPGVRVPLTLRAVCGFSTAQIAAVFLLAESTMAQRLVRAKHKIRQAGIPFRTPGPETLRNRLPDVLQVVYLVFTEGHRPSQGPSPTRGELCEEAIILARRVRALIGEEPEVDALLALLPLIDARRETRSDQSGRIVLLEDEVREHWDREMIREGLALVEAALAKRRPGPYQLQAAIAACHATADDFASTDWAQIAALYERLWALQPSPVITANRAVAVAMSQGPAAGLALLDELGDARAMGRWAPMHLARAELLHRLGRRDDALAAHRAATAPARNVN
jgi:RNA polymerase sigma-70 factor, ECF subfamily